MSIRWKKEEFRKAMRYAEVVAKAREKGEAGPRPDLRLEALAPYARGERLVLLHAENRVEILDALVFARELKLKAVLSGALEAWKVADEIKKAGISVILGGTLHTRFREHDPYDAAFTNPARLHAAGIPFAIRSKDGGFSPATNGRNLPYEAAAAVAFGLPADAALKAVTLAPAQILGVGDQLGSLDAGKRAHLVVPAGDILQPTTEVLGLFIDGKPFTPESRHTRLFAEYGRRLDEVKAGIAPLGLERPAGKPGAVSERGTSRPSGAN
jgi:imidazolonepropionase-like amidohydrolase